MGWSKELKEGYKHVQNVKDDQKNVLLADVLSRKKILTITKCVRFVMLAIISKMKGVQYYDIRRDKTRSE